MMWPIMTVAVVTRPFVWVARSVWAVWPMPIVMRLAEASVLLAVVRSVMWPMGLAAVVRPLCVPILAVRLPVLNVQTMVSVTDRA